MASTAHIGTSALRREGRAKLTGATQYTDDLKIEGLLHGVTVRSSVPRGRITAIRFAEGVPWHEFVIVTAKDVPGKNVVAHIIQDQPCLADDCINHADEAIVLLAHPDRAMAEAARTQVQVEVEELPAVLSIEDSLARTRIVWGEDNTFKKLVIDKGDPDSQWQDAHLVHEATYRTGAQEHLYIEPNAMIAEASPEGILAKLRVQHSVLGVLDHPMTAKLREALQAP